MKNSTKLAVVAGSTLCVALAGCTTSDIGQPGPRSAPAPTPLAAPPPAPVIPAPPRPGSLAPEDLGGLLGTPGSTLWPEYVRDLQSSPPPPAPQPTSWTDLMLPPK